MSVVCRLGLEENYGNTLEKTLHETYAEIDNEAFTWENF